MRPCLVLCTFALAATSSLAATQPAALPGPPFPDHASPVALEATCTRHLATAAAAVQRLERQGPSQRWLGAYDDLNALTEDLASPIYLLSNVHPDKAMRDASEACELRWQNFFSTLSQNEKLYRVARQLKPTDPIDREFLKHTLDGFEDSGVSLPPPQRARAKQLQDRIIELGQTFEKNIRDENVRLAFSDAELKGVPEGVWKNAKRDDQGRALLGLDYPTSGPVLQLAQEAATRERMWRAKQNEGGDANLKLLAEIGQLRREYAQLFGFPSYADFLLRRRMAENTATATRFLTEVKAAVAEREKRELEELREAKARDIGKPLAEVKLERWDFAYYAERVKRERYSVDQEAFRAYFPPQESLAFVMRVAEKILGVRYERVPGVKLWHPDAQAYVASDVATGKPLATLYVDPFPREGKYNHAAVWPIRSASMRLKRVPQAALVVNFDRKGLNLEEIETLLHEFGHAVHNNLGATRHSSGSSVLRDFVEAPSQMLEEWMYDPKVLAVMRDVCASCKLVPEELLAKAKVAERYGKGTQYARQRLFAAFDLALHGPDAPEPMALWERMERETPLGHVPGTRFPAGFAHTATHYGAGYYGYLWSEVVAADLRTAFGSDKLDARVGRRYRDTVLANGGQKPPQQLVRDFLGRPSNSQAFFEDLKR
ncbi:MAG TPA: M3 family metallopeptidase [Burkholderiaceae bacterium]|nr:M3 family metallopeptidase [Burkholderiaceae bacterium]